METLSCACGKNFQPSTAYGEPVSQCEGCGNLFIAQNHLDRILAGLKRAYTPPELEELRAQCRERQDNLVSTVRADARMYYICPVCEHTMVRRAFAAGSGIVIHQCPRHGSMGPFNWLKQAVEFVEKGGEVLVLQTELETAKSRINELQNKPEGTRRRGPYFTPIST